MQFAETLLSLRMHGQGSDKYDNIRIGLASRLDTIQAAILSEKLKIFPDEIAARDRAARRYYAKALGDVVDRRRRCRPVRPRCGRNTPSASPAAAATRSPAALKAEGIPTAIYYPIPLHRQQAYKHYPVGEGGVAVSDRLAGEVISLPMHAYLDERDAGPHHRCRRAAR